ncbi:anthranilate synthase component II [Corynebacterium pseudotuberculosis]|uniref:anthranilate synthase component II n=1 Tax=Corynebacterium pseudotuberculosis TaxID=1719 RepID=UPI0002660C76|nr:anthranilate synthase component II [Corynebacterium pseudotuberculosis]AFM08365.1 anthranilate synthase component II [Corynebacterium pseudotuberculosis Cp162]APG82774.1 Anthranilate synthase component II [Corynebacterium pseudotuberculosis]WFP67177.1 anthranilate synthase component II [Corynebacterium pseudotuberculosis]
MNSTDTHVVLLDNHDSFVYNLLDAFAVAGYRCTVFRNSVGIKEILAAKPDIICLSPGPGHPRDAGCMMELIDQTLGHIPILGICLGFQALLEHFGGDVRACGPVHGITDLMKLNKQGLQSPIFHGLTVDGFPGSQEGEHVPVARYHSLGCTEAPKELTVLGTCPSLVGPVAMAAEARAHAAVGLQFHPESILSPSGPIILQRCIAHLSQYVKDHN